MTITIELPPDVADSLTRRAAQNGQDVTGYVRQMAERDAAAVWDAPALAAWDALLDSFDAGEAEDHRETVATLAKALNDDRPTQRRVFGKGINPAVQSE